MEPWWMMAAAVLTSAKQPRLDPGQPGRLGLDLSVDLGPAQLEHPAQFRRADLLGQDRLHLTEGEAEVLQGNDAVQLGELAGLVKAVPAGRVHAGRTEQADRVVVPEHADRYASVPRELPGAEHDGFLPPDTVSGSTPTGLEMRPTRRRSLLLPWAAIRRHDDKTDTPGMRN
jgi:hypothetical protein